MIDLAISIFLGVVAVASLYVIVGAVRFGIRRAGEMLDQLDRLNDQ